MIFPRFHGHRNKPKHSPGGGAIGHIPYRQRHPMRPMFAVALLACALGGSSDRGPTQPNASPFPKNGWWALRSIDGVPLPVDDGNVINGRHEYLVGSTIHVALPCCAYLYTSDSLAGAAYRSTSSDQVAFQRDAAGQVMMYALDARTDALPVAAQDDVMTIGLAPARYEFTGPVPPPDRIRR